MHENGQLAEAGNAQRVPIHKRLGPRDLTGLTVGPR